MCVAEDSACVPPILSAWVSSDAQPPKIVAQDRCSESPHDAECSLTPLFSYKRQGSPRATCKLNGCHSTSTSRQSKRTAQAVCIFGQKRLTLKPRHKTNLQATPKEKKAL
ncbi:hypothetical protein B0H19DRAFT_1141142, partial [Mycena capillaripes]